MTANGRLQRLAVAVAAVILATTPLSACGKVTSCSDWDNGFCVDPGKKGTTKPKDPESRKHGLHWEKICDKPNHDPKGCPDE